MRLTPEQVKHIRLAVEQVAPTPPLALRLFGSRLDEQARGGDVDLLVEFDQPLSDPAWLAARIAGRVSRALDGRRVDVLLAAPNLRAQAIHDCARREGVLL